MSRGSVTRNRKAFHNYEIRERYQAGMVLLGTEIKAIRDHQVSLSDSYARIRDGEVWLENCHIGPYRHGNLANHEPLRPRKLLLHRREINRLTGAVAHKGFTLVPLALYFEKGRAKLELGVARGKRLYDKREAARRRAVDRDMAQELKRR
ncbi:MAG: SsrA-binding protein SmpB [Candidatus Aminicenantes bacterium]|nr:SsrA-binding protein SmpB [Candidatus Aminicenantes bacterium]